MLALCLGRAWIHCFLEHTAKAFSIWPSFPKGTKEIKRWLAKLMRIGNLRKIITFHIRQTDVFFQLCIHVFMPEHVCFLGLFLKLRKPKADKNVVLTTPTYSSEKHNTAFWSQLPCGAAEETWDLRLFSLPLLVQMPICPAQPSAGLRLVYKMCLLKRDILSGSLKMSPLKKTNYSTAMSSSKIQCVAATVLSTSPRAS